MKTITWNVRGLEDSRAFKVLCDFLRHENPHVIFLMETKCSATLTNKLKLCLNFHGCFTVDCNGRSGGLCLLWRDSVDVSIRSFSLNHIDC